MNNIDVITKANIGKQITSHNRCCAAIIYNHEGKIMLLKRNSQDSFHPSTYCCPGGGMTEYESSDVALLREVYEETGIDVDCITLLKEQIFKLKDVTIHYFICTLNGDPMIRLDEEEHTQYEWCNCDEWKEMDLILDLKQHLIQMGV